MICPLRLINIADQPDYNCVPTCAMRRVVENPDEFDFICGLGEIPFSKTLVNIVNFDRQPKSDAGVPENMEMENLNLNELEIPEPPVEVIE